MEATLWTWCPFPGTHTGELVTTKPAGLAEVLAWAGWTPRRLGREINSWLLRHHRQSERIHPTAPYAWVRKGSCPYDPYPSITAAVLSEHLGRGITIAGLWPHRSGPVSTISGATQDLENARTASDVLGLLGELAADSGGPRAHVYATSGPELLAAVADVLALPPGPDCRRPLPEQPSIPQAEVIAGHVARLRRIDDRHGGGPLSLRYVTGELRNVLSVVGPPAPAHEIDATLMSVVADLAQLLGWMHFDALSHGLAERYLLLAANLARQLRHHGRAANSIGMLVYITAHTDRPAESARIAEALRGVRDVPLWVQARVVGRTATAHAANGDLAGFRAAAEQARELIAEAGADRPPYLDYFNADQLSNELAQGLVWLADRLGRYRRRLLTEAVELLAPLHTWGTPTRYPRSFLLHGCYLAQAQLRLDDLPAAVDTTRRVLTLLPDVQSARCLSQLRQVRTALARRQRSMVVAEFMPELDQALSLT